MSFEATERRILWSALFLGSILSLVILYRVTTLSLVLGSVEGRWVYEYLQRFPRRALEVLIVVCALCGAMAAVPLGAVKRYQWLVVIAWIVAGMTAQGLLRSQTRYSFQHMFISDGSNGFYSPTLLYSPRVVLSDFDRVRPQFASIHARSNMPGKVMLVYALKRISQQPAMLAWLVVALSNLGGLLMYLFARDFFQDKVVGLVSLILYLFVPGKLFFFPLLNTVTPVLILMFSWLWLRWLQTGRTMYPAALGVNFYALIFFEPTPLVMGLLFATVTGVAIARGETRVWGFLRAAGLALLTFGATHAAMDGFFRFDLIATARDIAADAVGFNAEAHRPYSIWVRQNLFDFVFATGVCQIVLFATVVAVTAWFGRLREPIAVLCLGLLAVLLVTDLIGINRGEVVRLWIFLACFFQIPAAWVCARLNSRIAVMLVFGTTLIHDALGTAMLGFAMP